MKNIIIGIGLIFFVFCLSSLVFGQLIQSGTTIDLGGGMKSHNLLGPGGLTTGTTIDLDGLF